MKSLAFLAACGLVAVGCGSDSTTCPDGGCVTVGDGGGLGGPDGPMLWGLSRGMNNYKITAIKDVTDDCMIDVASLVGQTLPVNYDSTTTTISIGKSQGSPAQPSLGTGMVKDNKATLMRDNKTGDSAAPDCLWHQKDVSMLALFDHDKFTLAVTEDEDMFTTVCKDIPKGGKCTSKWTWTLELAK